MASRLEATERVGLHLELRVVCRVSFLLSEGAFMVQASQSFFKNGLIVELASAGAVLKAFTPCQ